MRPLVKRRRMMLLVEPRRTRLLIRPLVELTRRRPLVKLMRMRLLVKPRRTRPLVKPMRRRTRPFVCPLVISLTINLKVLPLLITPTRPLLLSVRLSRTPHLMTMIPKMMHPLPPTVRSSRHDR